MYIVQFQIQNIWNKNEPDNIFKNVPNPSRKNSAALQLNDYNKRVRIRIYGISISQYVKSDSDSTLREGNINDVEI